MPAPVSEIVRYTRQIRTCFQQIKMLSNELHADLAVNASHRAVLEWLSEHGRKTVPQIAEAKSVSRQHIQKTVDELIEKGHAYLEPNPSHKRSPFVVLTDKGKALFTEMQCREAHLFDRLANSMDQERLLLSLSDLQRFSGALTEIINDKKTN